MNGLRKRLVSGVLLLAFMLSFIVQASAGQIDANIDETISTPTVVVDSNDNKYVMHGAGGSTLLVKPVSTAEYEELTSILYPNGIFNEQGQSMDAIADADVVRAEYIANHTKAYAYNGSTQTEVPLTPFTLRLEDRSNGAFDALMYRCSIGSDTFIFPSEWGRHEFGFAYADETSTYLAYTDIGIWSINASSGSTNKLTSDTYAGKNRSEIEHEIKAINPESYLLWIDNVELDPSGQYVVYRTNRDAVEPDETSVWKVNLQNPAEAQLISPAINNDIVGFISDNSVVVGSLDSTRIVNVVNRSINSVDIPDLPNVCVKGAGYGKLIYTTYQDGSSTSTAYINDLDSETGKLREITSVRGYLDGTPSFSMSGAKLAISYGENADIGMNDIKIVDALNGTAISLNETTQVGQSVQAATNSAVRGFWLNEDTMLISHEETVSPAVSTRAAYDIVFQDAALKVVSFISPMSTGSSGGFVLVNSKWNQPRSGGTNPHNGVDLNASINTNVYAPYYGWSTKNPVVGHSDIEFLVDANRNKVKDDGDYYVRFYHMNACESDGYKNQGQLIGKSGNQGNVPAHLHFGICSKNNGLKWLRNEPNYSYLASSKWASGKDLDIYSQATTLIFYSMGYNLFTLRQASRRSWRINQTAPRVEVYMLYYADTMQAKAMKLMASKLAVAGLIEGTFSEEGLAAMSDVQDMTSQMAKELMLGIKDNVEDIAATFKKMAIINPHRAVKQLPEPVTVQEERVVEVPQAESARAADTAARQVLYDGLLQASRTGRKPKHTELEDQLSMFDTAA